MIIKVPVSPSPVISTEIAKADEVGFVARYYIRFATGSVDEEPVWFVRNFDTVAEAVSWFEAVAGENNVDLFERYKDDGSIDFQAQEVAREIWFASIQDSLDTVFASTHSQIVLHHTALVDSLLTRRLRLSMAPLNKDMRKRIFENYGPLSTLSAKIDLCYAFKIVDKNLHKELTTLRRIRNDFAHPDGTPSFNTPEIAAKCESFAGYKPEEDAFVNFKTAAHSIMRGLAGDVRKHEQDDDPAIDP